MIEKINCKNLKELDLRGNKIKRKDYSSIIDSLQYEIKK